MVWGIETPSNFGDFFPSGEYIGWEERLTAYFNEEMTAEQKAVYSSDPRPVCYINDISQKFTREVGAKARGVPLGLLQEYEKPIKYKLTASYKSLASLVELNVRLPAVDDALKGIIERLEPGAHQFWPIQIIKHNDQAYPVQYHAMIIRRFHASFLPEKSDEGAYKLVGSGYYLTFPTKKYFNGLAVSNDVVNGTHLWREHELRSPQIFMSNELHSEIEKAGLKTPKRFKLKVV